MALPQTPDQVADACGDDPTWICRQVLESTNSEGWARASDVLVAKPAHILLIVAVAWVTNHLIRRAIRRFTERIADPDAQERIRRLRRQAPDALQSHGPQSLRSAAQVRRFFIQRRRRGISCSLTKSDSLSVPSAPPSMPGST